MSKSTKHLRIKALADFLKIETEDISEDGELRYTIRKKEYLVLTDTEANETATEYIKDTAWAFNADFIIEHSKLPYSIKEFLQAYQSKECENANEGILGMIEDIDEFITDAIGADGRGHFLSQYDGHEHEQDGYFIYRTN